MSGRSKKLALLPLLILPALIAAAHLPFVREMALERLRRYVRAEYGAEFEAGALSYNLLTGAVEARDLSLGKESPAGLPPFLKAARLRADLGLLSLLGGRLTLEDATVEGLAVHLHTSEQGVSNVPEFGAKDKPPGEPPEFLIQRLSAGGSFDLEDRQAGLEARVKSWRLTVEGNPATMDHRAAFGLSGNITVLARGQRVTVDEVSLRALFNHRRVQWEELTASAEGMQIRSSGVLRGFVQPVVDARLDATLDLGRLSLPVAGVLRANVRAAGKLSAPDLTASFSGERLSAMKFRNVGLTAQARWSGASQVLHLDSASIVTPAGRVCLSGEWAGQARTRVAARIERLDLIRIAHTLGLEAKVGSIVSGSAEAEWPGLQWQEGRGEARLSAAATEADSALPVSGRVTVSAANRRAEVRLESIRSRGVQAGGRLDVRLSGELGGELHAGAELESPLAGRVQMRAAIAGTIQSPSAEFTLQGSELEAGLVKGVSLTADGRVSLEAGQPVYSFRASTSPVPLEGPVAGLFSIESSGEGTLKRPAARFSLRGTELAAHGEQLGELLAQARIAGDLVTLESLELKRAPGAGSLSARGTFDVATRDYRVEVEGKGLTLSSLSLPGDVPVRGTIDLDATGAGKLDNPSLDLHASAANLEAAGKSYGALEARLRVAGQMATLTASVPLFALRAEARAKMAAPYATQARIVLEDTNLAAVLPVEGRLSAVLDATLEAEKWRDAVARLAVSQLIVQTKTGEVRNDGAWQIDLRDRRINVTEARLRGPGASLLVQGALPGEMRVSARADLASLAPLLAEYEVTPSGWLEVDGGVRGGLTEVEPFGRLALSGGRIVSAKLKQPLENAGLELRLDNGLARVERLEATAGAGRLKGEGSVPLGLFSLPEFVKLPRETAAARFTVAAEGFQLESLLDLPEGIKGALSLRIEGAADRPALEALRATATFDRLEFEVSKIRIVPEAPPVLRLNQGVLGVERFKLTAPGTALSLGGGADLNTRQLRDVRLSGFADAGLLTSFAPAVAAEGRVEVNLAASGSFDAPSVTGTITTQSAGLGLAEPRLQATGLEMLAEVVNQRIEIRKLRGDLNGGTLNATGAFDFSGGELKDPRLSLSAKNVFLEYPPGLKLLSSADLALRPDGEFFLLSGRVNVHDGSYTEPIDIQTLMSFTEGGGVEIAGERSPLLSRLRFDIAVRAGQPLVVDNNFGELLLDASLRLTGSYYRPGLTGRIDIDEGGKIYLREREYMVERGIVQFVNEAKIEPSVNLLASTRVSDRNISLGVSGEAGDMKTDLTSDNPDDTQADIISLLLTGRTAEKIQGRELGLAGEQTLSLVAGSVTGRLSRGLENTLGLSQVRLEPSLISPESDPTARLTIGQDLAPGLGLVYSMDLTDSKDQIWILNYDVTRRFNASSTRQADNTYRFDFGHDLRFGGRAPAQSRRPEAAAPVDLDIGSVQFTGDPKLEPEKLAGTLKARPGESYDFFKVRKGIDRLGRLYEKSNRLEARLRLSRDVRPQAVDLTLDVDAGPRVEFVFENWQPSGKLRGRIRELWRRGVFDSQRALSCLEAIRTELAKEGYLQAEAGHEVHADGEDRKIVTFTVQPGTRYKDVLTEFDGARQVDAAELHKQIKGAEPSEIREILAAHYRQKGFLDAEVSGPAFEYDEQQLRGVARFRIVEGPLYRFGEVRFTGATAMTGEELRRAAGLPAGPPYAPGRAQESHDRLEEAYWRKGYRDVVITYDLRKRPAEGVVDTTVNVEENLRTVVDEVAVEGNHKTSDKFVRAQTEFAPGDSLDHLKTARTRRNLYNTGAYSSVDVRTEPLQGSFDDQLKHVRLVAEVRERSPFRLRYGAFYDTERGFGAIADFSNRNTLGSARLLGVRTRYDGDVREIRGYFSQPLLRSLPLQTDLAGFQRREIREAFITDRTGVSVQQEAYLRDRFQLTYGYRFENAHTFDRVPNDFLPFDETLRIAPLTASLSRDARDEVLDATRGSFTSHAFEFATGKLGSTLLFMKYYGQYFKYIGLSRPRPIPFAGRLERPRVIYAGGVRLGLAKGLGGQEIIRSERFFAGGGTTLRGFEQDTLGPRDFLGRPAGGDAVLIVNNELRFPLKSFFEAVSFVDLGNVYRRLEDFSLRDVRTTGGLGLRVRTPYFLVRVDYGLKLDRKNGESRGAFFFSIGQAF